MNAARELAATGTPEPWAVQRLGHVDLDLISGPGYHVDGSDCIGKTARRGRAAANAAKITKAVNALPAIGDLLAAVEAVLREARHEEPKSALAHVAIRELAPAKDALTKALR